MRVPSPPNGASKSSNRAARVRAFANMISVKLHTSAGERWIEGTVFEGDSPRLTFLDGVDVEVPLDDVGTMLVIRNEDQPGVIGEIGTILGRHGINIGSFALGRNMSGAVGVVSLDPDGGQREGKAAQNARAIEELRGARAIKEVKLVTLGTGAA